MSSPGPDAPALYAQIRDELGELRQAASGDPAWLTARSPQPTPQTPGFSADGYELPGGGVLEWPDQDGYIALRDADGDLLDSWNIDEEMWPEQAKVFGLTRQDFPDPDDEEIF